MRAGIRSTLEEATGIEVVDDVSTVSRLSAEVQRLRPDPVVVSLALSTTINVRTVRDVVVQCSRAKVPVMAILDPDDADGLLAGIATGLRGCVSKFAVDDLPVALKELSTGRSFISAELVSVLFRSVAQRIPVIADEPADLSSLSRRERTVLELIGTGLANNEIARKLNIKETTVRSHLHHTMLKLNLRTRAEAVILGYRIKSQP